MKRVVRTCQVVRNSSVLDLRSHSCSENDNLLLLVGVNQIACVALDDNVAEDNELLTQHIWNTDHVTGNQHPE